LLGSLPYASFLSYSPRGTASVSLDSRRICYAVKQDGPHKSGGPMIEAIVAVLARDHRAAFADFLGPDVVLVPTPKSAPLPSRGGGPVLWVPRRISEALVAAGLGTSVVPCVERVTAVAKSASAAPGQRPTIATHMESMQVLIQAPAERITLVDDVVTRGATLFAAASLLASTFPLAEIRAFALIRTRGFQTDIDRVIDPTVGTITRNRWGDANRDP
jgi:hypothetical protein